MYQPTHVEMIAFRIQCGLDSGAALRTIPMVLLLRPQKWSKLPSDSAARVA